MGSIKDETLRGAKWQLLRKATLQPIQLIFSMVLARLISPEEMGILGLTAIFFAIAAQLASAGFGAALIRKIDRTEEDINTMFWFNAAMSLLMALCLFLAAPWFADFYHQPDLVLLTRISAVMMFLNSFSSVHWTLYTCRRDFKTPAIVSTIVALLSMPICLWLAFDGWSYWAIVAQGVFSGLLSLCIVWCVSPWKPRLVFSIQSFRELFGFGSKLAASGLLYVCYSELRTFIIGKFYSPAALGMYSRGSHISAMIPQTVSGVLESVSYPILSTVQNDDVRLTGAYRKYIKISTMVLGWVAFLVGSLAVPLVLLMFGENWLGCVPFIQILALAYCTDHICSINLNLLKVKGRSDLFLRLECIKRVFSIGMVLYAATIGVEAICWAAVIYNQIAIFMNCYYTGKILGLSWWAQQKDYFPYLIAAAISVVPACFCSVLCQTGLFSLSGDAFGDYLTYYAGLAALLMAGASSSAVLYFGYLQWRRDESLLELLSTLAAHPRFSKVPLLGRWARHVSASSER